MKNTTIFFAITLIFNITISVSQELFSSYYATSQFYEQMLKSSEIIDINQIKDDIIFLDIMSLQNNNIHWFVLPKKRIFMEKELKALLDQHLKRWKEDEKYIIWNIPTYF